MFDLHRALTADGIAICRPADYVSGKKASLEDYYRDVIALLTDYPPARFYFVRFSDETVSIDTPLGEGVVSVSTVTAELILLLVRTDGCGCIHPRRKMLGRRNWCLPAAVWICLCRLIAV